MTTILSLQTEIDSYATYTSDHDTCPLYEYVRLRQLTEGGREATSVAGPHFLMPRLETLPLWVVATPQDEISTPSTLPLRHALVQTARRTARL